MRSWFTRYVLVPGSSVLLVAACSSSDEDPAPLARAEVGCGTTDYSICGYAFDDLTDELGRTAYTAPFSSALDRWDSEEMCQGTVLRGRCADGKDFLYWKLGDTVEVRYYDSDGRPTAVAVQRATGTCGDPCPLESFYGTLDAVRCEAPEVGALCGVPLRIAASDLPFSEGAPTNACFECTE
jgi:hypothetical protein